MLSAISGTTVLTPIDVLFFGFNFIIFLQLFLIKEVNIAIVGNVPGNVFFKTFPRDSLVWPFFEAKVKF